MQRFGPLIGILACLLASCSGSRQPASTFPAGYPLSYAGLVTEAHAQKTLNIWSVTDTGQVQPLLDDFRKMYPGLAVNYTEMPAETLYRRTIAAETGKETGADLLWSSAMDLQIKLVNDGYAQAYSSPEVAGLPEWAVWKNEAWGVTAEPIVIAYNRRLLPAGDIPETHADFRRLIERQAGALKGKVATYDPSRSAVGFLYLAEDQQANRDTWELARDLGRVDVKLLPTTGEILAELSSGKVVLAYNMIGSYVLKARQKDPSIALVLPRDYTLVMSRIAVIPASARNASGAKLFLDYLLSRRGQAVLAQNYMRPVRSDLTLPPALHLRSDRERSIRVSPSLLVHQDRLTRISLLKQWDRSLSQDQGTQ